MERNQPPPARPQRRPLPGPERQKDGDKKTGEGHFSDPVFCLAGSSRNFLFGDIHLYSLVFTYTNCKRAGLNCSFWRPRASAAFRLASKSGTEITQRRQVARKRVPFPPFPAPLRPGVFAFTRDKTAGRKMAAKKCPAFMFLPPCFCLSLCVGGSALPNASRTRRAGVLPPSILRIPHSGLSFRPSYNDHGIGRGGKKTYGSVFGTIFWGGDGRAQVAGKQRVATEKVPKNRKNAKKSAK